MMENGMPLEGCKVIDLTWLISGPIACRFLADRGAEVIKLESGTAPDNIRLTTPFNDNISGVNRSTTFANYNADKYSLTLNLNHPLAAKITSRLSHWADIIVESFRPGTLDRWGLSYDRLKTVKPEIIMVSMTMQGQTGPFNRQPGVGTQLQALTGFTHLTGWPDREPAGMPVPYPDFISPWYILIAVLAGLDHRRRTGQGLHVDMSQLETSLQFLSVPLLDFAVNARNQSRRGNTHRYAAPHGIYPCRGEDRWCAIGIFTDEEWDAFCRAMGSPVWTREPRFSSFLDRKTNEDELNRLVAGWTSSRSLDEVTDLLQQAGVRAGPVQNGRDLLESDSQLAHRRHFRILDHPEAGRHAVQAAPYRFSQESNELRWAAPCLGEHNSLVCSRMLGIPDDEFIELVTEGVFD